MALPKLNSGPKYNLTIPSSNQEINYRPFLMKEEKALLIAMESKNTATVLNTLTDIINSCIDGDNIKINNLTTFDIEYMFLKIRSKSVGENADVALKCSHCEAENKISVNLDEISVDVPDISKIIEIDENIKIEVDWPSYKDIIKSGTLTQEGEPSTEQMFQLMNQCFKTIITEDERIKLTDVPKSEVQEFLDSMTSTQFSKIQEFMDNIPKLKHTIEFECVQCKEDNKQVVEGVANFLS